MRKTLFLFKNPSDQMMGWVHHLSFVLLPTIKLIKKGNPRLLLLLEEVQIDWMSNVGDHWEVWIWKHHGPCRKKVRQQKSEPKDNSGNKYIYVSHSKNKCISCLTLAEGFPGLEASVALLDEVLGHPVGPGWGQGVLRSFIVLPYPRARVHTHKLAGVA